MLSKPWVGTAESLVSAPRILKCPLLRNSLARMSTITRKRREVYRSRIATCSPAGEQDQRRKPLAALAVFIEP